MGKATARGRTSEPGQHIPGPSDKTSDTDSKYFSRLSGKWHIWIRLRPRQKLVSEAVRFSLLAGHFDICVRMIDSWGLLLYMDVDELGNCMAVVNPDIIVFHPQGDRNKNIGLVSLFYVCLFVSLIRRTFHLLSSSVSSAGRSLLFFAYIRGNQLPAHWTSAARTYGYPSPGSPTTLVLETLKKARKRKARSWKRRANEPRS